MPVGRDDKKEESNGFGHVWQKDAEMNECEDCGSMVDTWCKHCEACQHCDAIGKGHACKPAGDEL